jgi:hypothetical protein
MDFELSAILMSGCVDAFGSEPAQMLLALLGIDNVYGPISTQKAFPDERK